MNAKEAEQSKQSTNNNPFAGLWSGRNGLGRVLAIGLSALLCAWALQWTTERYTAAPVCAAYGQRLGLTYLGAEASHLNDSYSSICNFRRPDGSEEAVSTARIFPFFTGLWVSFAMDIKMMAIAFIGLFALVGFGVNKLRPSRKKKNK